MRFIAITTIALSAILAGCATNPFVPQEGTSTGYGQAQQATTVVMATVIATRDVRLLNQNAAFAERTGAAIAGIVGLAVAREATNSTAMQAVLAGLAGTVGMEAGRQTAGNVRAQELVIRADNGLTLTVAQSSADGVRFNPGQRVMLIGGGRVAPVAQ